MKFHYFCSKTRMCENLPWGARFPVWLNVPKSIGLALGSDFFHRNGVPSRRLFSDSGIEKTHVSVFLWFLSRNVTFFCFKRMINFHSGRKVHFGSFLRLKTLYTYEIIEGVAKITKTRNYYYFASEIEQNWSKLQKTHFRVFTGVARNHSRLMPFHHFPWQSWNSSRNVTFFCFKKVVEIDFCEKLWFRVDSGAGNAVFVWNIWKCPRKNENAEPLLLSLPDLLNSIKSSQKSSKSIRGVAKIENRIFPANIPRIIGIPLVKQCSANQWKHMRKALEGLQKSAFSAKRAQKGSEKHYTVCKNHIGNHFSEIPCNTCRFLCVLESENDKKRYPESIILCAKVTSCIIYLESFVILVVS